MNRFMSYEFFRRCGFSPARAWTLSTPIVSLRLRINRAQFVKGFCEGLAAAGLVGLCALAARLLT